MKQELKFTFLGGDDRQKLAVSILAQDGFPINVYGWNDIPHEKNVRIFKTLDPELLDCNVLMLPVPYGKAGKIHIPDSYPEVALLSLLQNLKPGTVIIFGKEDKAFSEIAGSYPFSCYDILKEESFSVRNAIPTAEGAIQRAMEQTDITLHQANVLILGYGRIGKVLSRMLLGIGSHVAVEARSSGDIAWIEESGCQAVSLDRLDDILGTQDIIFNTVPAILLDRSRLGKLSPECRIIDLASHPGGVDFEAAEDLGIHATQNPGLPGLVAPRSAARVICQSTMDILERHFQYDGTGGESNCC